MRINRRVSAGILATALVAGLFTAAPVAAFAEGSAPTEPQVDVPSATTQPAEPNETVPEEGATGEEDLGGGVDTPVTSEDQVPEGPAGSADPNVDGVELPEAPATQATPGLVPNAIISKCTVNVSLPKTVRSGSSEDQFSLAANGVDCVRKFTVEVRRINDNRVLAERTVYSSNEDYQNGRIDLDVPNHKDFSIAGKYRAVITASDLESEWAWKNGFDPYKDHPKITYGNNVMDLRHVSKTTFAASRATSGVAMRGTLVRYHPQSYKNIAQAKATVQLQKKQGNSWVTKKTVTTNSQGKFSATVRDNTKASWRAYVPATGNTWAAQRGATVAKKSPGKAATKVSRSYSYNFWTATHGTFTVAVKFNAGGGYIAAHKGVKVAVQKQAGSKWKSVKTISTNSSGKLTYAAPSEGRYRFVVKGTSSYVSKTSASQKTGW